MTDTGYPAEPSEPMPEPPTETTPARRRVMRINEARVSKVMKSLDMADRAYQKALDTLEAMDITPATNPEEVGGVRRQLVLAAHNLEGSKVQLENSREFARQAEETISSIYG